MGANHSSSDVPELLAAPWRLASYALACLIGPLFIVLLSKIAFSDQVVPDFALTSPNSDLPVNLFNDLSKDMLTVTAGIAVSSIALFRLPAPTGRRWFRVSTLVLAMTTALLAGFCGLRFRYELAQLVRLTAQELDPVLWRLHLQALFLMAQVSILSVLSVHFYFHKGA